MRSQRFLESRLSFMSFVNPLNNKPLKIKTNKINKVPMRISCFLIKLIPKITNTIRIPVKKSKMNIKSTARSQRGPFLFSTVS